MRSSSTGGQTSAAERDEDDPSSDLVWLPCCRICYPRKGEVVEGSPDVAASAKKFLVLHRASIMNSLDVVHMLSKVNSDYGCGFCFHCDWPQAKLRNDNESAIAQRAYYVW